jgi:hypothetical protein
LQGQRVQRSAHGTLQGSIDHLVLLYPAFSAKTLGDDRGGIMVAVAGEIANLDLASGIASLIRRSIS